MTHDKISFVREYCRCRRIPYRVRNEALFIEGEQVCYSIYNLTYVDLIDMIDEFCDYNEFQVFYQKRLKRCGLQ